MLRTAARPPCAPRPTQAMVASPQVKGEQAVEGRKRGTSGRDNGGGGEGGEGGEGDVGKAEADARERERSIVSTCPHACLYLHVHMQRGKWHTSPDALTSASERFQKV